MDAAEDDFFVRPFMITSGRTVGDAGEIPIEAMLQATGVAAGLSPDAQKVHALCSRPTSIAEIGAHLGYPVGVARVLVADLVGSNHLQRCDVASATDETTLRRLLDGIRAI